MGSASHSGINDSLVFLVDDLDGSAWLGTADAALRELPSTVICLNETLLGQTKVPSEIVQRFSDEINRVVSRGGVARVFVVTDSFFGTGRGRNEAGYNLLLKCREHNILTRGVVYSADPQGTRIPDVVELVEKSDNPTEDFTRIAALFRAADVRVAAASAEGLPLCVVDLASESEHAWDSVLGCRTRIIRNHLKS